ncbi:MAG: LytR C-terminal domain-containing protein [Patescibacteria group bacterium]|nr:LytR C-terminal domain-containing protein [Patescibacteria group bacterium]
MQKSNMEENQFQEISRTFTPGRPKKSLPKKTVVLIVVVVLIILAFLFVKLSGKSAKQSTSTASTTPSATEIPMQTGTPIPSSSETPTPTPTASPTPKPSVNPVDKATGLDRSKLSVTIQNGSGQAGVAGTASDYLTGLGYNVFSTGNADNYNYTNVFIKVKAGKSDFLSLLKKDLGFKYTIGTNSADLSDSSSEDALVIIGK